MLSAIELFTLHGYEGTFFYLFAPCTSKRVLLYSWSLVVAVVICTRVADVFLCFLGGYFVRCSCFS